MYTEEQLADSYDLMMIEVMMKKPNCNTQLNWYFEPNEGKYIYDGCDDSCNISYKLPPGILDPLFEELKTIENYNHSALSNRMMCGFMG